jgi:hypothetical protein
MASAIPPLQLPKPPSAPRPAVRNPRSRSRSLPAPPKPPEDVETLLKRVDALTSDLGSLTARWDDQRQKWDAVLDKSLVEAFPSEEQHKLGISVQEHVLESADLDPGLRPVARQIRTRSQRHGSIGILSAAGLDGICSLDPASLRHYSKLQSSDSGFRSALARAVQPVSLFFRAVEQVADEGTLLVAAAHDSEQTFDKFIALRRHRLTSRQGLRLVTLGSVSRELVAAVKAAAVAITGLSVSVEPIVRRRVSAPMELARAAGSSEDRGGRLSGGASARERDERAVLVDLFATVLLVGTGLIGAQAQDAAMQLSAASSANNKRARTDSSAAVIPFARAPSGSVLVIATTLEASPATSALAGLADEQEESGQQPPRDAPEPASLQRSQKQPSQPQSIDVRKMIRATERELIRLMGVQPCRSFHCVNAASAQRHCSHLCPLCLRKVLWATSTTVDAHYAAQLRLYSDVRLPDETRWLVKRIRYLFGNDGGAATERAHAMRLPQLPWRSVAGSLSVAGKLRAGFSTGRDRETASRTARLVDMSASSK